MLKIRIMYTNKVEMKKAIESIEKDFEVISLTEQAKSNNPKYKNSKYKTAYADVELKNSERSLNKSKGEVI